ncbi:HAD family hydrolase [bacterium]|nr:HAD family hydrolase [bacterium]RQV97457.1 MAG: HAD family hydrolase [bacterium]
MDIEGIIFDLDGTLLDTLEDIANSANSVLASHQFPTHSLHDYRYFVGSGSVELIKRILPEDQRTDDMIRKCTHEFFETYDQYWNINTRPYVGITQLLRELKVRRLKLAVLSNKPDKFTQISIQEWFPENTFDIILGQSNKIPRKPDPAGAFQIAKALSISPAHFLYIGDTNTDMQTATAAGMFPVGVLWGFRSQEELENNGAKALVNHPKEILTLLNKADAN